MIMSIALFTQVWASCVGPAVAVETGAAVARAESGFNTLAIHDNTTNHSYAPADPAQALAIAKALRSAGNSLDLGLMQIDSANLARVGLTTAGTFDPCRNMAAGAQILVDDYLAGDPRGDIQIRLRQALSRYNTGNNVGGFKNGYVERVQAAADQIVPAIRLQVDIPHRAPIEARRPASGPQAAGDGNSLIDGLIHLDTAVGDTAIAPGTSDDALIHTDEAQSPSLAAPAPPQSEAPPLPSG